MCIAILLLLNLLCGEALVAVAVAVAVAVLVFLKILNFYIKLRNSRALIG